jgi:arsenate reductase
MIKIYHNNSCSKSRAAFDLIRKNEPIFKEKYNQMILTDEEWIDVMLENPILIERPIVIKVGQAAIGRPIENIISLLK